MKITDVQTNKKQINEFDLSNLVGDYGSAAIKKMFGKAGGKTVQHQMAQDMYIKDFVGKAISSLETAIQGGLVDPNLKNQPKPVSPGEVQPEPNNPGSTARGVTGAATPGVAATPAGVAASSGVTASPATAVAGGLPKTGTHMSTGKYKQQQATTQNLNNYVRNVSAQLSQVQDKNQKVNLTKELVNFMADRKDSPEWTNALKTAEFVLKKSGDPNFATAAIQKLRQGQRMDLKPGGMSEAWQIYYINKLIEGAGLTWKDLGLSVLKENRKYRIIESKYLKLNKIFEQILTEAESINQYLQKWFKQYMKGVDYSANQQDIDSMIDAVQSSYGRDKGRAALSKLANTAWAVSQSSAGGQSAGTQAPTGQQPSVASSASGTVQPTGSTGPAATAAEPETSKAAEITAQATDKPADQSQQVKSAAALTQQMNNYQLSELIKISLERLKKIDTSLYSQVMKSIAGGKPIPTQTAAAPAVTAAEPKFSDKPVTKSAPATPGMKPVTKPAAVTTESKFLKRK